MNRRIESIYIIETQSCPYQCELGMKKGLSVNGLCDDSGHGLNSNFYNQQNKYIKRNDEMKWI